MKKKSVFFFILPMLACLIFAQTVFAQKVSHKFSENDELVTPEPSKGESEEKLPDPLVDEDVMLIPLSSDKSIFLAQDRSCVVFLGEICLQEGMLEFFVCSKNSKEHESIIATKTKPSLIHVALLAMGIESGKHVQFTPNFVAASGPRVDIIVRWMDQNGERQESRAEDWILETKNKSPMTTHWVFSGSMFRKLEGNKNQYLADVTGEIIGVSNFPTVVLDLPIESSSDNSALLFEANSEKIPPIGTAVTIILSNNEKENKKQLSHK